MPIISQFYGIIVTMYFEENMGKHFKPHIHVRYSEFKSVYDFDGNILEGTMPLKQRKMIEAWIVIHKEELQELWRCMQEESKFFKIEPLK